MDLRPPKVALVTGCSEGGVGFSFCQKLLARGYIVYATARSVDSMRGLQHANMKKLSSDVTSDEQVSSVVQAIMDAEGYVDLVINNAGKPFNGHAGPTTDYTSEEMKSIYDANVFSIQRVARAVVPRMAKRKQGTIVNMGSIVGEYPTPWMGVYDSSKGAVRIMSEVLSMECRPFNIKVVLVAPSSIQSKIVGKHDDYRLPPESIYTGFFPNIRQRLEAAREDDAMPSDVFAERVISKVVSSNPPSYMLLGGKSTMFRIMAFLPRSWVLSIVWGMFSKPRAKEKGELAPGRT
ncbi:NAD-P-binding protein [Heliocybe sulcata]|uniref:NAD-P-binding protein n=1 Tax=Heliocybe sulcata TaxID=5364 RepID=A0A5C3MZU7_9AGAM|nr:NAD-P-binding protein [Heliocybe sulcata]